MDYIGLRHKGIAITLSIRPVEKIEELLTHAELGDTLHKIPEELCSNADSLLNHIASQLASNEFVAV